MLNIAANQTNVTVQHGWSQEKVKEAYKQAEVALRAAEYSKAEAIKANELKSSFLANMSHEIRTPLGAILGFTDILKSSKLTALERGEYLDIITRSGQALTKIIDDILDLSKIEAGKLEIENSALSLSEVCREVVAMFSDRAVGKGISLNFDDSKFPTFLVWSDQMRVRQVLVNLIGNAVKFTSQGSVTLSGDFTPMLNGQIQVVLSVSDTGIGM